MEELVKSSDISVVPIMEQSIEKSVEKRPKERGFCGRVYKRASDAGLIRVFIWFFLTFILSIGGAWAYRMLESDNDYQNRLDIYNNRSAELEHRKEMLQLLVKELKTEGRTEKLIPYNASLTSASRIRLLLEHYEMEIGIDVSKPVKKPARWTFQNAMFFCCSLYNSLGFGGRLYPLTESGMVVTMIYSFIGIPFMLAMTSDLGLVVFDCVYYCWWSVVSYLRSRPAEKERIRKQKEQAENVELFRKEMSTLPVYYGAVMSVLSLALCSGLVQLIEPTWDFYMANYYYVTSFLTIGLGDISPSAPKNGPEWTLLPHTILLIFCMTFIGLFQHVLDRRIELVFATIENGIHVHFRNLSDNEGAEDAGGQPHAGDGDAAAQLDAADVAIAKIAGKMGFGNRMYYGAMDQSRSRLLQEIFQRKAKMRNKNNQTRGPKRDIGCQHLNPVDDEFDITAYGDYLGPEYAPKKKDEENIKLVKYLYNCD